MGKRKVAKPQPRNVKHQRSRHPRPQARATSPQVDVLAELQKLRAVNRQLQDQLSLQNAHHFGSVPANAPTAGETATRDLPEDERCRRQGFAENLDLPGRDAPTFSLIDDFLTFGASPWADPLTPAYLLDKNYRIIDWNLAFGIAFDHTMDGRRGMSVLEWVYFLDNYETVLKNAEAAFSDPNRLPRLHVEPIQYASLRYGKVSASKRAYQVPSEDDGIRGWLVTLEVGFENPDVQRHFRNDLFTRLRQDLTWSEYALSYDRVLLASQVYIDLLDHILGDKVPRGGKGEIKPLRNGCRVLDCGAGSGNLSARLAHQGRRHLIFAVENNRAMLDLLREKCRPFLQTDDKRPGVLAIKQDINALYGVPQDYFDVALLNNVLYAIDDPVPCLKQVYECLTSEGEVRISGPQKSTNLDKLFSRIGQDLRNAGKQSELQYDFSRVLEINRGALSSSLYRWTVDDMVKLLRAAGFTKITHTTESAYGGQAMLVCARKGGA